MSERDEAPFDIKRRARELFGAEKGYLHAHEIQQDAIQLARETAESIAKSCEVAAKAKPNEGALAAALRTALTCAEIARRHCRPPEPETNEERVAMLERALRSVVDEYDANRCGTTSGWKREEPGARFVDAIDKARRALGGGA